MDQCWLLTTVAESSKWRRSSAAAAVSDDEATSSGLDNLDLADDADDDPLLLALPPNAGDDVDDRDCGGDGDDIGAAGGRVWNGQRKK